MCLVQGELGEPKAWRSSDIEWKKSRSGWESNIREEKHNVAG
jgi:hypothetical protein